MKLSVSPIFSHLMMNIKVMLIKYMTAFGLFVVDCAMKFLKIKKKEVSIQCLAKKLVVWSTYLMKWVPLANYFEL